MSILKRIFEFYIYSNIHVSIAVFSLTKITLLEFGINKNTIPFFALFATLVSYNLIRFYRIDKIHKLAAHWIRSNKIGLILLLFIGLFILTILLFKIKFEDLLLLTPFLLATLFYVIPFSKKKKNLRSIASLKLFLIAFTWAGITVLFPLAHHDINFSTHIWVIFIQRFLIIIAITIPFDIRDVDIDIPEIKTLPQTIGIKNSKYVGSIALLLFFVMDFFHDSYDENTRIVTFTISVLSLLLLVFANKDQNKYYSSFWVEGVPIFWYLLFFLLVVR
jgi:hypothetical protein